jgi:acyl dehydratase
MTLSIREATVGDRHEVLAVQGLTRTQIVQYAGASGDFNPLHTDEVYATRVAGFRSVFAHGMLTMAITGRVLTDLVGVGRVTRFGGRFTAQVWPGDDLTVLATITAIDPERLSVDLEVATRRQDGTEVFRGYASAIVNG